MTNFAVNPAAAISVEDESLLCAARTGSLAESRALALAGREDTAELMRLAADLRDMGHRNVISYSRKVFIPLTQLCRDVCHYRTFAQTPKGQALPYMSVDAALALAREGAAQGCREALFTLGEKPEQRYSAARDALRELGYETTLEYLAAVAGRVFAETGLLPHINAGCMNEGEIAMLRPVSASMGIMLESTAQRLCEKGGPHYASPDKDPALRLETLRLAGQAAVPLTTGILIGIGETRGERIESLLAIRKLHQRYGHIQEVIIQNLRAKPGTLMAGAAEPGLDDMLWTVAVARLIFGPVMNLQAPPNLSPGALGRLIDAGINDWGGVSPVSPDHVNPEAPWPQLEQLAADTAAAGKFLQERLTIYPGFASDHQRWLAPRLQTAVLRAIDAEGFPRVDSWETGTADALPALEVSLLAAPADPARVSPDIEEILERARGAQGLDEKDIIRLFQSRGADFARVCQQADALRKVVNGDDVSYVVTRNINYTNICYFKCQFCAFSKGKLSENLRGRPYDLSAEEIRRRTAEAWQRGATEVCMQGGINPDYTGQTYIDICHQVKAAVGDIHIHAFSPLEIWQGAQTLGLGVETFLGKLIAAGLGSLPGTAAEILDDEIRAIICPDKITTAQWFQVMEAAHSLGLKSTATIMFGHVEGLQHWARHLVRLRELQQRSGGFTEFVPLPFVASEAPIYLRGKSRRGPTFRESVLMHAIARLALHPWLGNIQASWVKLGEGGVRVCMNAGVNDLGGTLMNETITRSAGATHGQETSPQQMESRIRDAGRLPRQRTTGYGPVARERARCAFAAAELSPAVNDAPVKQTLRERKRVATAP